jgi:hypothetical protein
MFNGLLFIYVVLLIAAIDNVRYIMGQQNFGEFWLQAPWVSYF